MDNTSITTMSPEDLLRDFSTPQPEGLTEMFVELTKLEGVIARLEKRHTKLERLVIK